MPHRRALVFAMYPSTIGLSAVTVIALVLSPELAAVLAGILAGLGLAALYSAGQLILREHELGGRLFAERGRGGRVFLSRPGEHA
jgi:hypothetical protein